MKAQIKRRRKMEFGGAEYGPRVERGDEPRHGRETRHPAKMMNKLINQNRKSSMRQNRRARKH